MNLVHPQLIWKMIQKVESDGEGNLFVHTKAFVLNVRGTDVYHTLTPREGKPEPLVIPAKKA